MITAVFDVSNMVYRSMYLTGGFGKDAYTFDKQFELDQLMRKVATDVTYTIRQLNPTRVILAIDDRSWRKDIEIEENEGYKGNREKSEMYNWDNIYAILEEFVNIARGKGFVVSKKSNAEADDLMALWMDKLTFERNEHVIFVSGDEDIRQLVKLNPYDAPNKGYAFSTVFNPFTYKKGAKKKLYVPAQFQAWLNHTDGVNDIFHTSTDPDKDTFKRMLNTNEIEVVETNGDEIGLKKIFCGDDGDNVPAIYTWMTTTAKGDPIQRRITDSKYKKIAEELNLSDYIDAHENADKIGEMVAVIAKHSPPFNIKDRLDRQIKLVILNRRVFPEDIVQDFDNDYEELLNEVTESISSNTTMVSLLEGTRYVSEIAQRSSNEADIFKQMDEITKKLF